MLDTETVLSAYLQGFFPMADEESNEIYWHSPDPRAIIPLDKVSKPKSHTKAARKKKFKYTVNSDFEFVISACSDRRDTWISKEIIDLYIELHKMGHAHSIETWKDDEIVGGLYGISIGGAFFGESMFNTESEAAKASFFYLVDYIKSKGFVLLDTQYINPFTQQLGAIEIPKSQYLKVLSTALNMPVSFNS